MKKLFLTFIAMFSILASANEIDFLKSKISPYVSGYIQGVYGNLYCPNLIKPYHLKQSREESSSYKIVFSLDRTVFTWTRYCNDGAPEQCKVILLKKNNTWDLEKPEIKCSNNH